MRFLLVLFMLLLVPAVHAAEEQTVRIEGIMYDKNNPDQSVALISGGLYKPGDHYQNYVIQKVGSEEVEILNPTTGETRLLKAQEVGKLSAGPPPKPSLMQNLIKKVTTLAPIAESDALNQMRSIQAIVMRYTINDAYMINAIDLPALVRKGLLSREYEDGIKGAYKYSIRIMDTGAQVQADPVEENGKLRHFLLDNNGTLYYEYGKSASRQSKFMNS